MEEKQNDDKVLIGVRKEKQQMDNNVKEKMEKKKRRNKNIKTSKKRNIKESGTNKNEIHKVEDEEVRSVCFKQGDRYTNTVNETNTSYQ